MRLLITVELRLNEDENADLSAMLFQAYNLFTDPENYYEAIRVKFTDEFRTQHRKNVISLLKKLGWDAPPEKDLVPWKTKEKAKKK